VVTPAVLTEVSPECNLWGEEAFGPITVVSKYKRFEEAIMQVKLLEVRIAMRHFHAGLSSGFHRL
jgi:acyl-CoA reductase-like NAD-dependent aldehyde dehydrogenase